MTDEAQRVAAGIVEALEQRVFLDWAQGDRSWTVDAIANALRAEHARALTTAAEVVDSEALLPTGAYLAVKRWLRNRTAATGNGQ